MKSFKRLITLATLAMLALVTTLMFTGALTVGQGIVAFAGIQLLAFSVASPQGALFTSALSPAQVQEFESIIRELSSYKDLFPSLKDLANMPGGFAAIKTLPNLLTDLRADVNTLRRQNLSHGGGHQLRPGQLVTDDCAEYLAAIAITAAEKQNKLGISNASSREALMSRAASILGLHAKAALTPSDIPLPTGFSGQVVALVNQYGSARRYGTVFPLSTGTIKLPRLKTDTAFGLIGRSAAVTEKSPQTEWVTFAAEKFGGLIRLPSEISEDSIIAMGQFIAEYAARQLAAVEDQVFFLNLDGSTYGAVKGLCGSTIDNSKVVQLASTKTHYSDATLAKVRELRNVPDASALRQGAYYMHSSFEQLLSGFNTAGDRPYNPNAQLNNPNAAQPFITGPTLDGFPVRWIDQMPAYSTGVNVSKVFMLFGALSFQYLGVTTAGIRIETSVEAAFDTDEILIRALERFTIGLMANGSVGGLQTAAS